MNSKYRIYPLILCLLLTLYPIPGMAESGGIIADVPALPDETTVIEAAAEEDVLAELPVIEAETESAEPGNDPEAAVLPGQAPLPDTVESSEITGVASGADYSYGYAKLVSSATGYNSAAPDAQAILYLESGVFFVSARRASVSGDRLRAHFDDNGETRSLWIDERCLRPMSASEVSAFVSARLGEDSVRLYGGDIMLPLDSPASSSVITYSSPTRKNSPAAPAMFVSQTHIRLAVGETQSIGVSFSDDGEYSVAFSSGNETIASVSDDGLVTGLSAGTTHIRLRSEFSNFASIEIQVQN